MKKSLGLFLFMLVMPVMAFCCTSSSEKKNSREVGGEREGTGKSLFY